MAKYTPLFRGGVLVISALTIVGSFFYSQEVGAQATKLVQPPGSTAAEAWQDIRSNVVISGNVGIGTTIAPSQPGITVTNGGALRFDSNTGLVSNSYSNATQQMAVRPLQQPTGDLWQISSAGGLAVSDKNFGTRGYLKFDGTGFGIKSSDDQWRVRTQPGLQELPGLTYMNSTYSDVAYDRNNPAYFSDPNATSRMHIIESASYHNTTNGSWIAWPNNNWNYLRGPTQAFDQPWYDETNGAYYLDPSATSSFNSLNAGALYDAGSRVAISNAYGRNSVDFSSYLKTTSIPNNNVNSITQTGFYHGFQPAEGPGTAHYSILHSEYPDGTHNWFQELAFDFYSDNVYYRRSTNGAKSNWRRMLMQYDDIPVGSILANGNIFTHANMQAKEIYSTSWFRVYGGGGIYWENYGGGWHMQDSTWMRTYNNKSVYTTQIMRADSGLQTNGVQVSNNVYGWGSGRQCLGCADSVAGNPNLWLIANSGHIAFRDNNCPGPGGINNYGNCYAKFDVAELYPSNQQLSAGDVVSISSENTKVEKSTGSQSRKVVGVVSTNPAVLIDGSGLITGYINSLDGVNKTDDPLEKKALTEIYESNKGKYPVALAGRVPVKVTSKNGSISFGDAIGVSDITGFGTKATQAGNIVGKAMAEFKLSNGGVEGYQCSNVDSVESINWPVVKDTDDRDNLMKSCFRLPDGSYVGKVMMFVNTSTYDPDAYLASTDGVKVEQDRVTLAGQLVKRIGLFAEIVVGRLQAGVIETKQLVVDGVDVVKRLSEMQAKIDGQDQEIRELKQAIQELQSQR